MSHRRIASQKRKPTRGARTADREDTVLAMYSQGLQVTQCLCTLVTAFKETKVWPTETSKNARDRMVSTAVLLNKDSKCIHIFTTGHSPFREALSSQLSVFFNSSGGSLAKMRGWKPCQMTDLDNEQVVRSSTKEENLFRRAHQSRSHENRR
eukprot:jgi/Antlo1/1334/2282